MLNPIDYQSATWTKVQMRLIEARNALREKNDSKQLDAIATAHLRGRIAMLTEILDWPLDDAESVKRDALIEGLADQLTEYQDE